MANYTIQEIFNLAFDETNSSINLTTGSGTETPVTIQDILNNSFDDSANAIKTSQ